MCVDPQFIASEDYTNRFYSQIAFIRKHFKEIYSICNDMSSMLSDLGTLYNGWSLTEDNLSIAFDQIGQAIDVTTEANQLLSKCLLEYLGMFLKEYENYTKSVENVLKWRHKKHVEFETLSESLVTKQGTLEKLESSEHESQRLTAVLNAEGVSSAVYVPPAGVVRPNGIFATINSFIDNDPENTRRKTISKTKDKITTIEDQREKCRQELLAVNEIIQKDLDGFQQQKIKDFRNALLSFAMSQRDYHLKCLSAWKDAKNSIDQME